MAHTKVLVGWKASSEELETIKKFWPREAEPVMPTSWELGELQKLLPEIDVVVGSISEELLTHASKLKMVQTLSHGIDNLMSPGILRMLMRRKISVVRANPAAINVAEFVLMSMIALSRRVLKMHEALVYQGSWSEARKIGRMKGSLGGELYGSVLGLLGFGAIGKEIARRANAFGMSIGALDLHPEQVDKHLYGVSFTATPNNVDQFLGKCDYVVISLPLTSDTRDFMNHRRFQAMKNGSYLINISRGAIVVEEALYDALRSGKLAGASSDVWRVEEEASFHGYPFPFPIHQYNVIMTPHYCGATQESRKRAIIIAGENLRRWLKNEPLLNVVDLKSGF